MYIKSDGNSNADMHEPVVAASRQSLYLLSFPGGESGASAAPRAMAECRLYVCYHSLAWTSWFWALGHLESSLCWLDVLSAHAVGSVQGFCGLWI